MSSLCSLYNAPPIEHQARISMEHGKLNFVERDDSIFAGAIFMSNRETKLECLQRKLFGLPLSKSKFLKQVKAGMILFLFEHEERKLYGVFEATSDGALNIIPDAFRSTGQSYPAQILFKRIWMCKPLCEDEFCSAIEENYYSPNKFHFGLSYKQVIKLIHLFYSRKINIKQYKGLEMPNKIIEKFEQTAEEDVGLTETETYFKCRSDEYEYGGEGKREVRRQLAPPQVSNAPPQVSFDPAMLYERPASTTSMLHTFNLPPLSYPHNSYSENLNPQRCSVCLSHDHSTFRHFSIGKQPSSTSQIEYEPPPFRSIGKQPSTACEIEYEPPPFRSIGKQPSIACEIEYEPPPFRSIGKQPSTACEIDYEPPRFRSIGKQPSTACEIEYEPPPFRSIGKQPSTACEIDYEPPPFRSIGKQPSTACEIKYEPPPFRSIGKQPSTACEIEYEPPPFRSIGKQPSTACEIKYEPPPFRSIGKQPSTACEIEYEPFPLRPIGKQPSTTLDIEYEPLPLHSYHTLNFDNTMAPNSISSSPNNVPRDLRCNDPVVIPRMTMIQKDAFAPSPFTNNSRPQTEILQPSYASGAQPNQGFKFSDYIPLVEESRHKLDNSSLLDSEYIPSSRLNSYIPSTSREASKYFYSADGYSDDNELKTRRRVEADEYNAAHRTLHADSVSSRNTVFSRLSRHQDICNDESPEPSSGEPSGVLSLDHFLNILSTRRNLWSSAAASKPSMERNSHNFTARFHHRTGTVMSEVDRHDNGDDDGLTDAEPSNDVLDEESFKIPFYNFRRRNTIQKCEAQDCSNKCSEAKLMESKRRRIVRPSLKAEAEVKTLAQSEEITEVETSVKNASEFRVVDSVVDGVVAGSQTVRKCEPVGESIEPSHVTSMDESLDYIPID